MRLSVLVPAALLALLPLGCAGNDPNQYGQPGYGQPGYGQPGYGQPAATGSPVRAAGLRPGPALRPARLRPAASRLRAAPAATGSRATASPSPTGSRATGSPARPRPAGQRPPIAPGAAAAATPILMGLGQSEAPGAQPDGGVFAGQFQEGQSLEQPINIQAGKCYTVVAAGMGIQQLEVQIVAQPAPMFPPTVIASSNGGGPTATVGGRASGCVKNPLPIGGPAKVILKAMRGAGMAAAQVYSK